jgi:hypothetical protein
LILLEAGKHDEAIAAFESLGNYKDAAEHLEKYQKAYVVVVEETERGSITYEYKKGLLAKETIAGKGIYDKYYYQEFSLDYGETLSVEYEYDVNWNVSKIVVYNDSGTAIKITTRAYDDKGNLIREAVHLNGYNNDSVYTCNYDDNGNLIQQLYYHDESDEAIGAVIGCTNYEYDEYNRLIEETQEFLGGQEEIGGGVFTSSYVYDENNRLIKKTRLEPYSTSTIWEYTYNATGYVVEEIVTTNTASGGLKSTRVAYEYDEFGNLTKKISYSSLEQTANGYVTEYTYDCVYLTYLLE